MLARRQAPYDVCIIGSGAGGGMAAYALTKAGARVVMLEAGRRWYASKDSQMLMPAYATPQRGARDARRGPSASSTPATAAGRSTASRYTRAPGTQFGWWRARMLGGRTNHWGRISLRFGPDDFRGKTHRRTRRRLADRATTTSSRTTTKVDDLIGIFGSNEGTAQSSGRHLPAAAEAALLRAAGEEGVATS